MSKSIAARLWEDPKTRKKIKRTIRERGYFYMKDRLGRPIGYLTKGYWLR